MKVLPFYVVLLNGLFFGMGSAAAHQPVAAQVEAAKSLESRSQVWVIKEHKPPEHQPFVWVFKDLKKLAQQPLLQLAKEADKADASDSKDSENPQLQPFNDVIKNTKKSGGLFTLYRQPETGKIYLEIKPEQLNKNYLGTVMIESGIGERGLYSGMPLQDFLFYFRRVNNNLHFVVRNVNFRTNPGDPQARSIKRSFSDSVLYSLKIKSIQAQRKTILVDLGDLLLSDVPGLSSMLADQLGTPYRLDDNKSYFGAAKAFPLNMEINSVYGFSAASDQGNGADIRSLPDGRALSIKIHYSFSQLPENDGYHPRLADDRIGYFLTAYQDFSNDERKDPFVRYINRWHLEKQDPKAALSPPKKPIVFWIENAVPLEYREAIKEGVLMWNQAFEQAGFKEAIQVRQMPDNAKWQAGDVRYNTIRWFNSVDGLFAMGPSRVNPLTGEILNAEIIVDAGFVRSLKQQYRTLAQQNQSQPTSSLSYLMAERHCNSNLSLRQAGNRQGEGAAIASHSVTPSKLATESDLCYGMEAANQYAVGSLSMSLFHNIMPNSPQMKEYIRQYLRLVIAHEVGHTLGLRHNFRGSSLLTPEELNNTDITHAKGLVTSVMDYIPPNLAPQGMKQGDYFPAVVGPYDRWAIKYGYKPSGMTLPQAESRFLEEIAKASTQPELDYAPDEDSLDLDPDVNPWANSSDVLRYSQWQLDNARAMWNRLDQRYPARGESYSELSQLFDTVFFYYLQHIHFITKYIGGQYFHRDHAGEPHGRLPFEAVSVEKQRQALTALQKYVFADDAFKFSPQLLNKLAPSRWRDWGHDVEVDRLDYPIHDSIFLVQSLVLRDLLSGDRLARLQDIELKSQPKQALTLPELFDTLQTGIWTEVLKPDGKLVQISSLRRALQREHLNLMTRMVLRTESVPEDARTLAWYKLRQLREQLDKTLAHSKKLDEYTKAHLEETSDRIHKTLNAQLRSS